jgi:hypothetical protein
MANWTDEMVEEAREILCWRREELLRAGYAPAAAEQLACEPEVDLHFAVDLLERGCPAELALEILL